MLLINNKRPPLLGVDISKSFVKVVELGRAGAGFELKGYAIVPLAGAETRPKDEDRVALAGAAIRKAVKQLGSRLTKAVTAVPSAAVIVKTVTFADSLSENDIEAQIELEAEQYIPYPLDEVSLDFLVLGPSETMPDSVDVEVVASRKEYVEDCAASLEWAGLKAEIVDVDSFALERVCRRTMDLAGELEGNEIYAIADIGIATTTLIVIKGRQVIFTREQTFGGRQLTEEIQKRYGLPPEDAERVKIYGGLPDSAEGEVLTPFVKALGQQIDRSLHFFRSSQPQYKLSRLFLAGGCGGMRGIAEQLAPVENFTAHRVNPFQDMSINSRISRARLAQDTSALATAAGLALRSFDE